MNPEDIEKLFALIDQAKDPEGARRVFLQTAAVYQREIERLGRDLTKGLERLSGRFSTLERKIEQSIDAQDSQIRDLKALVDKFIGRTIGISEDQNELRKELNMPPRKKR